jgi:hypothetical protein
VVCAADGRDPIDHLRDHLVRFLKMAVGVGNEALDGNIGVVRAQSESRQHVLRVAFQRLNEQGFRPLIGFQVELGDRVL